MRDHGRLPSKNEASINFRTRLFLHASTTRPAVILALTSAGLCELRRRRCTHLDEGSAFPWFRECAEFVFQLFSFGARPNRTRRASGHLVVRATVEASSVLCFLDAAPL